jgi:hypothetical protein
MQERRHIYLPKTEIKNVQFEFFKRYSLSCCYQHEKPDKKISAFDVDGIRFALCLHQCCIHYVSITRVASVTFYPLNELTFSTNVFLYTN